MAKRLNGNLKFYVYIGILIAGLVGSYAIFGRDVVEMKPEVKLNSEHRIRDMEQDKQIQGTLNDILKEVRK